MAASWSN